MNKKPEISLSVNSQDCGMAATAEELEAIGFVFLRAARAVRLRQHGAVDCQRALASIGIDWGGPFSEEKGLPILDVIKLAKRSVRHAGKLSVVGRKL